MTKTPDAERQRQRAIVVQCAALVDLLDELYPNTRRPDLNASDREVGAWIGERNLIERLRLLQKESAAIAVGKR